MQDMPLISVIVPVYKVEAYLDRCVQSLVDQTYRNLEILLVDDGSPDNSGAICDQWAARDQRVKVIHKENGGLSDARNAGIEAALRNEASQWLTFVDSDDWVEPDFLEQLYRAAAENECLLSVCGYYHTSGEKSSESMEYECRTRSAEDFYCDMNAKSGFPCVACNKLYHKSLFRTLRFPLGKLHEDEFTTYQAVFKAGRVAVLSAALYAYYQNDAGIMHSRWSPRRLDALEAYEQQIAFAQKNNYPRLHRAARQAYVYNALQQLEQNRGMTEYRDMRRQLKKSLHAGVREGIRAGDCSLSWTILAYYDNLWFLQPIRRCVKKARRRFGG